jgi:hypothetical protein
MLRSRRSSTQRVVKCDVHGAREVLMKKIRLAIGTILLASMAAIAMPLTAGAFGGHGGGGGGHGGFGGGFHGGGFGGGFHGIGGGGFRGIGGHGFHGIGGMRFGGGGMHLGGHHVGGLNAGHRMSGLGGRATRLGGIGSHAFTNNSHFGHDRFGRDRFGHNRFGHDRFGGGFGGWVGPVFWPYAYDDISCGIFWGYGGFGCGDPYWSVAYGNPFWEYGYGDIYSGLFSPFASADLVPDLPSSPSSVRRARSKAGVAPPSAIAQMCGDDSKEVASWPIDRIQQLVSPDDHQRILLDELADASVKAAQIIKSGCPASAAFTPTGRLATMERRIEVMEQAIETVRGPLDTFYDALTDEQKAKFNTVDQPPAQEKSRRQRGTAQSCSAANVRTQWPEARIDAALHPNEAQREELKTLQSASVQAAEQLAASCPGEMPATPPARLAALSKRLDVMHTAVKEVRGALDKFYGDLTDEQKAQFNQIGQAPIARRQG